MQDRQDNASVTSIVGKPSGTRSPLSKDFHTSTGSRLSIKLVFVVDSRIAVVAIVANFVEESLRSEVRSDDADIVVEAVAGFVITATVDKGVSNAPGRSRGVSEFTCGDASRRLESARELDHLSSLRRPFLNCAVQSS